MKLYIEDFEAGVQSALLKAAEGLFDLGGSAIFPRIESQAKWRFARKDNHLRLSDGTNVYGFHLPHGEKHDEDFPAERIDDIPHTSFGEDVTGSGTAQIHRADPGSIYFTLQDGTANPTYTFRHQGGKSWKAIPKRKVEKVAFVDDKAEFLKGAMELMKQSNFFSEMGDKAVRGVSDGINGALNGVMSASKIPELRTPDFIHQMTGATHIPSPLVAAGVGLGAGALYDQGKRHLYNSDEENEQESGKSRAILRYMLPAAGMAGLHAGEKTLWPNYSRLAPTFDR